MDEAHLEGQTEPGDLINLSFIFKGKEPKKESESREKDV
jgi:hypothetical protein